MTIEHKYNTRYKLKRQIELNNQNIDISNFQIFNNIKDTKLLNYNKNIKQSKHLYNKKIYFNHLKLNYLLNKKNKLFRSKKNIIKHNNFNQEKQFNVIINNDNQIQSDCEIEYIPNKKKYKKSSNNDNIYFDNINVVEKIDSNSNSESDTDLDSDNKIKLKKSQIKDKKLIKEYKNILKNENNSITYFKKLTTQDKYILLDKIKDLKAKSSLEEPYEVYILNLNIEEKYKIAVFNKVKNMNNLSKDTSSTEYIKLKNWVESFTKIPFNNYVTLPVTINDGIDKCKEYIINAKQILDKATYGLNDAKSQILQFIALLINNPNANGLVLGIKGPMGTGKTTLVKDGISKILNRPFEFLPLAGIQDGSFFDGHSYTYEGSKHGKIVDILMQTKCMNPIIYGDELDKISNSNKGDEIVGILTHLTDTTQASQFCDKYFSEINLNLNKIIYIFSYNDESNINPILKDRMYKIETTGYTNEDKLIIAKKYLIPKIIKELNCDLDIQLGDEDIRYIINNYTNNEKGVRNLKRSLETIYHKLNLYNLVKSNDEFINTYFKNFNYNNKLNNDQIRILLSSLKTNIDNIPYGMYN